MVTINEGTQTPVYSIENAGTAVGIFKLDVGAGSALADFGGTIRDVANLTKGTITALASGTITNGTVSVLGLRHPDEFATIVSSGTSDLGTIKAGVSGSVIYVTSLVASVGSASNLVVASGGTSTPIGGTWFFNANGGIAAQFDPPIRTASGSSLVFKQSSAISPMSITCTGYVD